jgi:hypothetical protein
LPITSATRRSAALACPAQQTKQKPIAAAQNQRIGVVGDLARVIVAPHDVGVFSGKAAAMALI